MREFTGEILYPGRKVGDLTLRGRLSLREWATICLCGRECVRAAKSLRNSILSGYRSACDHCNRERARDKALRVSAKSLVIEKSKEAIPDVPVRPFVSRFKPIEEEPPVSAFTSILCRMGFL